MACSEARLAANRANALKSTGPRTEEGKLASRRKALKHGLTGAGVVIAGEDAAALARESAAFLAELAPDGAPTARLLAGRVATLAVRLKRSERHNEAATAERCRLAGLDFDEARRTEADRLFGAIDEGAIRDELRAMPEGLDLLDAELADLRAAAVAGRWSDADSARLARCLGADAGASGLPLDRIDEARAHLAGLRPGLDRAEVERARAAAINLALVDDSPEALRARRYEAATERAIHQALREIRRWRRADPAPARAPAPSAPTKPPARGPLADPSSGIPAQVVREAERMRELLIGLPPLGPGTGLPPLGSIFPAGLDLPDFALGSIDVEDADDDEPAPRGRSRFGDRRKRPRLDR